MTPIISLCKLHGTTLYCKRDDLLPLSFGGNKARKAVRFFEEIDRGGYDCVVTYGSGSSNHCRVVSNLAVMRGLRCEIISPEEASENTFNRKFMEWFGANITVVPVSQVADCIEKTMKQLRDDGEHPYFIPGGGHGVLGTGAYVDCYEEIRQWEKEKGIHFSHIFLASGTGGTQAGLICGQLRHGDDREIVGISIARRAPYGRNVVVDSVRDYWKAQPDGGNIDEKAIQRATHFLDDYIAGGYACSNAEISSTIYNAMTRYAIPLDHTYTGKAFWGMEQYLKSNKLEGSSVLFLHTGGTPLFFDDFSQMGKE